MRVRSVDVECRDRLLCSLFEADDGRGHKAASLGPRILTALGLIGSWNYGLEMCKQDVS